jgi:beta-glucanase (GH16 family)
MPHGSKAHIAASLFNHIDPTNTRVRSWIPLHRSARRPARDPRASLPPALAMHARRHYDVPHVMRSSSTSVCMIIAAGLLNASLPVCTAQRPAQNPMSQTRYTPVDMGYELAWEDQFNGDALDPKKWEVRGVGPRALGFVSPEAVKVEDGFLKLSAFRKDGRILIGAVGTQNRFMTRYGYFECRAQLQKSPGIWAAFWIQSTEISKGEDPALFGAEIDIMEFFRKLGPDIVSHNVHWAYGPNQKTTRGMQSYLKGVSEGFHDFALEWTPDKYVFFVDGYKFYEVTTGISKIEEYMILSMEIPSNPKEIENVVLPDVFVVDYVRVYKKKPDR